MPEIRVALSGFIKTFIAPIAAFAHIILISITNTDINRIILVLSQSLLPPLPSLFPHCSFYYEQHYPIGVLIAIYIILPMTSVSPPLPILLPPLSSPLPSIPLPLPPLYRRVR